MVIICGHPIYCETQEPGCDNINSRQLNFICIALNTPTASVTALRALFETLTTPKENKKTP